MPTQIFRPSQGTKNVQVCSVQSITNIAKFNTAWFSKFQIMG
jgi:hypothetical protein